MKTKYLYEHYIDFLKERLPTYQKDVFERRRQTDNVVVWICGLSTGAIALILSISDNWPPLIDILILKLTIAFLFLTIISGVVFRFFIYFLEQTEADITLNIEQYCFFATRNWHIPIELTEKHTIEQIAQILKENMGQNYDDWLKYDLPRDFWVKHYNELSEGRIKIEEEGFKNLAMILAPLVGKKPKETEEFLLNRPNNKKISDQIEENISTVNRYRRICNWSYSFIMIFFVLSFLMVAIGFWIK